MFWSNIENVHDADKVLEIHKEADAKVEKSFLHSVKIANRAIAISSKRIEQKAKELKEWILKEWITS
jgi:hypothetical protein